MIPKVPEQRQHTSNFSSPFDDLIDYIEENRGQEKLQLISSRLSFKDILDYAITKNDIDSDEEKCIAVRTHCVFCISTAAVEMNIIASKNTRCIDPVFHVILSWPEFERPSNESIFDAAEHALKSLGLQDHQYVVAIHANTDNIHCHIAANRIHPKTFRSRHLAWTHKTLHYAARESEIKHGWSHDSGLYMVNEDSFGNKFIVENKPDLNIEDKTFSELNEENSLPPWHDPTSLESWLKSTISQNLKNDLPHLTDWQSLHAWLSKYSIKLSDTGGGGMRLLATSSDSRETLEIACSKGLRILKRSSLEQRWGPYKNGVDTPALVPDLSHLTQNQISDGVHHYLTSGPDRGIPPHHVLRSEELRRHRFLQQDSEKITIPSGKNSHNVNESKRRERVEQRAAERLILRRKFTSYAKDSEKKDFEYNEKIRQLRLDRKEKKVAVKRHFEIKNREVVKGKKSEFILLELHSNNEEQQQLLKFIEIEFQKEKQRLDLIRLRPLSWRAWLTNEAGLGDQAALSALRGIVYQEKRDAFKFQSGSPNKFSESLVDTSPEIGKRFNHLMARLLPQEKSESAIRSADQTQMRPFESNSLLVRYSEIQWSVTGNGNVKYKDKNSQLLFVDRGNRITFDRAYVSDAALRLSLVHAQKKFGQEIALTGSDPVFCARMACMAQDMGLTVLNEELQPVLHNHQISKNLQNDSCSQVIAAPILDTDPNDDLADTNKSQETVTDHVIQEPVGEVEIIHWSDRLRAIILEQYPLAHFVEIDTSNAQQCFIGKIVAKIGTDGFAQSIGRNTFILHHHIPPSDIDLVTEIRYQGNRLSKFVQTELPDHELGK